MDLVKMNLVVFGVLFGCFALCLVKGQDPLPSIQLSTGSVIGRAFTSTVRNISMKVYKGIPYANPPVGESRFMAPVAANNWTVVKNLTLSDWPQCAQIGDTNDGTVRSVDEDCLVINVYTPQSANSTTKLPVMVWIYGGALEGGNSSYASYAPDYFVEQNVIFVSFNYRVGALGFLNLGTTKVPGNAGLKDQNLALRWVNREIGIFGGDNSKVTLFGESSGCTSVIFHYISPMSQGLFARAICESGNAFGEMTFLETGYVERATTFAGLLNCTDASNNVNLTCLQVANVTDILANQQITLNDTYVIPANIIRFPATPEKTSNTAILNDTLQNMLQAFISSNSTKVPLILGVNKDEGVVELTTNETYYSELVKKLQYFIPQSILDKKSAAEIQNNTASIYQEYFNSTPPSLTNLDGYIKLYGDKMFKVPTADFARQIAVFGNIYLYHFAYSGGFQQTVVDFNTTGKVSHGEELNYLFYRPSLNQTTAATDSTDLKMLNKMVKLWTNFAKYGNPTPDDNNNTVLGNLTWNPLSNQSYPYLNIINDIQMNTDNFYEHEVTFWRGINNITTPVSFGSKTSCSILLLLATLIICKML